MPFRVLRLASSEAADRRQAVQIRQAQLFNAGVVEEQEGAAWANLVEQLSFCSDWNSSSTSHRFCPDLNSGLVLNLSAFAWLLGLWIASKVLCTVNSGRDALQHVSNEHLTHDACMNAVARSQVAHCCTKT